MTTSVVPSATVAGTRLLTFLVACVVNSLLKGVLLFLVDGRRLHEVYTDVLDSKRDVAAVRGMRNLHLSLVSIYPYVRGLCSCMAPGFDVEHVLVLEQG